MSRVSGLAGEPANETEKASRSEPVQKVVPTAQSTARCVRRALALNLSEMSIPELLDEFEKY